MYSVTVCNQMKNKKYHTHCRNSSKIKYQNRRNRQNRYTNTHMTDPFPGLEQALRCKVVGLMDIKFKKNPLYCHYFLRVETRIFVWLLKYEDQLILNFLHWINSHMINFNKTYALQFCQFILVRTRTSFVWSVFIC